jgi:hypothetical protein
MTNETEQYWYPVTQEGVHSFLKSKSEKTRMFFDLMLHNSKVCNILKRLFVHLEKKRLSKTLEEYSTIPEIIEDYEETTKKRLENQNWLSKKFSEYVLLPVFIGYLNSLLDVDLGSLRQKEEIEFTQAMFLASIYLHL